MTSPVGPDNVERISRGIDRTVLVVVIGGMVVLLLLAGPIVIWPMQLLFYVVAGWAFFLVRVMPQVTFSISSVLTSLAAAVLFAVCLHLAFGWLYRATVPPANDGSPRPWRRRWTAGIASLILLAFASGIAALGVVHQLGWLATAPDPMTQGGMREVAGKTKSMNNLKQVALAMHNHNATVLYFPAGYTIDAVGRPMHGWQTPLLPYLEQMKIYDQIRLDRPWDDPVNHTPLHMDIAPYTSPYFGPQHNADGYSLSHYAGNSHVLRGSKKKGMRVDDFKDGLFNTVLFGEVSAGLRPWGHPLNVRDPSKGLHRSAEAFGGPWPDGKTHFAFGDGSVRSVSPTTSPAVLKALATPAGGEGFPKIE